MKKISKETRKEKQKRSWRRLDNSAKIFPIIATKEFSNVFRLSVILKEDINQELLQKATENTLKIFKAYKVCLRKGFFWYYLEKNEREVIVKEENNYPCKYIDKRSNNGYLFQVTYYKTKINVDIFHTLTDGTSGIEFLKQLTYEYIYLVHGEKLTKYLPSKEMLSQNVEDEYMKHYDSKNAKREKTPKAYLLKGKVLPLFATGVVHEFIEVDKFKSLCKETGSTITEYLAAILIYSISKTNNGRINRKRPIKICIPVDLKNYFGTETLTNFFSYITIEVPQDKKDFNEILDIVKQEFKDKLKEDEIKRIMSSNVKIGSNLFIKVLPLFFKKFSVKITFMEIRKYSTTTLSNIGKIDVIPEYQEYVEAFLVLLAPEKGEKTKCSVCSFENKLAISFTSILEKKEVQDEFKKHLEANNILVEVESNGVYDESIS